MQRFQGNTYAWNPHLKWLYLRKMVGIYAHTFFITFYGVLTLKKKGENSLCMG